MKLIEFLNLWLTDLTLNFKINTKSWGDKGCGGQCFLTGVGFTKAGSEIKNKNYSNIIKSFKHLVFYTIIIMNPLIT